MTKGKKNQNTKKSKIKSRKEEIRITQKDIEVLQRLYELRAMAAGQIKRAFYNNSTYGYRRIIELKTHGYLGSRSWGEFKGGAKQTRTTAVYWISDKGIKLLNLEKPRTASKNKPKNLFLMKRQILINEVYTRLMQLENQNSTEGTWEWIEAREAKSRYGYNKSDLLSGCLKNLHTNDSYAIYIPSKVADDEIMIKRLENEIDNRASLRDIIVLCTDAELFQKYRSMRPVGRSLRILPHLSGTNLIYNLLSNKDKIKKLYAKHMNINYTDISEEYGLFFATHKTQDFYLAELLSNDIVIISWIERRYIKQKQYDKPLKILCWDTQLPAIKHWATAENITLYPLKWDSSTILHGVNERTHYAKTVKDYRVRKGRQNINISVSLPPALVKQIDEKAKFKNASRSSIIREALENTEWYKPKNGGSDDKQ